MQRGKPRLAPSCRRLLFRHLLVLLAWTLLFIFSMGYNLHRAEQHAIDAAVAAAKASIDKDISFRSWVTSFGGVYVPPNDTTPVNPYLDVPERDVYTTDGMHLTLINPAYALRNLQQHFGSELGIISSLTSLRPLNPDNAPDAWEERAMLRFEQGETLVENVERIGGEPYVRILRPLVVEPGCLRCHGHQGYRVGDIRGGIGTSVALEPYLATEREHSWQIAFNHGLTWLIGVFAIGLSLRQQRRIEQERLADETALKEQEALYHSVTDSGQALIWMCHADGEFFFFNQPWLHFTGRSLATESGRGWMTAIHEDDRSRHTTLLQHALRHREAFSTSFRLQDRDGRYRWLLEEANPRFDASGQYVGFIAHCIDITARKQAEAELRLAAVAFDSQQGMMITDADARIVRVNPAFSAITGYASREVIGATPAILKSGKQDDDFYRQMWSKLAQSRYWEGEIWNRRKHGELYPQWLTITAVEDENGQISNYVGTLTDISERKRNEEQIRALAFFDPLTGLPNRRLLHDRLEQALTRHRRSGHNGALVFIDLDNFKALNDSLGHDKGDLLLQHVARRLQKCIRQSDTVARFGGDEFVILLEELAENTEQAADSALRICRTLLDELNHDFDLDTTPYHITPSIGITLFTADTTIDIKELFKQADIAMYKAKQEGRNTIRIYGAGAA